MPDPKTNQEPFCKVVMDRVSNGFDWEAAFLKRFPMDEGEPLPFLETSMMMFDVANMPSTDDLRKQYDDLYHQHYHLMSIYYEQGFITLPFWGKVQAITETALMKSTLMHKGAHMGTSLQPACSDA